MWIYEIHNRVVFVNQFVSIDDSTTRKRLKQIEGSSLPQFIPTPLFYVDVSQQMNEFLLS